MKNICVFCGSSLGFLPIYQTTAIAMGQYLAKNNLKLVYGAGNVGLMGVLADSLLDANGEAMGVIPHFLAAWEVAHKGIAELIMVETMHERKMIMATRADAFVAMPGGYGTLDELFEILTWRQLQLHNKPIGLLNVNGYFDPLLAMMDTMVNDGFLKEQNRKLLCVATDIPTLFDAMQQATQIPEQKWIGGLEKA